MTLDAATLVALSDSCGLARPITAQPLSGGVNNANYRLESATGSFFLKRYETTSDQASLSYEHALLMWLNTQSRSFAVPTPLPATNGNTLVSIDGALYSLFAWLPGARPLPTPGQAIAFGQALGELHTQLAPFPTAPRPGMASYGALGQIHPALPHPERLDLPDPAASAVLSWWRRELRELEGFIAGPYRQLPRQVVHGDVAFGNSLFAGETLVALLDFEFAGPDARVIDLASALWGLLSVERGVAALPLAQALVTGYRRVVALRDDERAALPTMIRLRNVVHTIWWVGRSRAEHPPKAILPLLDEARQQAELVEQHAAALVGLR
jgi:homoserine kinase type II